jgi:hypothetical protein
VTDPAMLTRIGGPRKSLLGQQLRQTLDEALDHGGDPLGRRQLMEATDGDRDV